jgi:hypothetical protein
VAVALGVHQAAAAEHLQVMGDVRHRFANLARQGLDRPRPLAEQLQELEAGGVSHRLADPGDFRVERGLEARARPHSPILTTV